jgi:hypothetical protein
MTEPRNESKVWVCGLCLKQAISELMAIPWIGIALLEDRFSFATCNGYIELDAHPFISIITTDPYRRSEYPTEAALKEYLTLSLSSTAEPHTHTFFDLELFRKGMFNRYLPWSCDTLLNCCLARLYSKVIHHTHSCAYDTNLMNPPYLSFEDTKYYTIPASENGNVECYLQDFLRVSTTLPKAFKHEHVFDAGYMYWAYQPDHTREARDYYEVTKEMSTKKLKSLYETLQSEGIRVAEDHRDAMYSITGIKDDTVNDHATQKVREDRYNAHFSNKKDRR